MQLIKHGGKWVYCSFNVVEKTLHLALNSFPFLSGFVCTNLTFLPYILLKCQLTLRGPLEAKISKNVLKMGTTAVLYPYWAPICVYGSRVVPKGQGPVGDRNTKEKNYIDVTIKYLMN